MHRQNLSPAMSEALAGLSMLGGVAPIESTFKSTGRRCPCLERLSSSASKTVAHAAHASRSEGGIRCLIHQVHRGTIKALLRRGLIERVMQTNEDRHQQSLWDEPTPTAHIRLTHRGQRAAALARLGRGHRRR